MAMTRGRKPRWVTDLAQQRMETLLALAEENCVTNPARSRRYVELARKIGSKYTVRLSKKWKQRICKNCNSMLVPGKNCRVRLRGKMVQYSCLQCGKKKRYGYAKKAKTVQ